MFRFTMFLLRSCNCSLTCSRSTPSLSSLLYTSLSWVSCRSTWLFRWSSSASVLRNLSSRRSYVSLTASLASLALIISSFLVCISLCSSVYLVSSASSLESCFLIYRSLICSSWFALSTWEVSSEIFYSNWCSLIAN